MGEATRGRYVAAALEAGWVLATAKQRAWVVSVLAALAGSRNATAKATGLGRHGLRRVLANLPLRPEEATCLPDSGRVLSGLVER